MREVTEDHLNPDVFFMGETELGSFLELKPGITLELNNLEAIYNSSVSSAELYWVEQKKLELFRRIFGF